jgi:ubiquinol-cytochrome c reductase cytochrome b subunit/menaquinol-cytochrome c reductase cytochrome b subunit
MPKLKLPAPPVPPALKPTPRRPHEHQHTAADHAKEAGIGAVGWVDERMNLSAAGRWMLFRKIPKGTNWFYTLGSATMFAFLNQAITGVFLAMYYDPNAINAYESVRYISNEAFLGEFVRGMHKWGSSVMVVLLFLHMGRTFLFGAYKYPREMTWITGAIIFILVMAMSFTGYLLVFDERAYWATVVGVNINGTAPILGPALSYILMVGPEISTHTLSRFYALHMLALPGAIGGLIALHLWLVIRLGVTSPPWSRMKVTEGDV